MLGRFDKNVGIAKIVEPAAVAAYLAPMQGHPGGILCECPEMGFVGTDLIYCRYGLSLPFLKIQEGWKVLIEPTYNGDERWFYTGIADCTGTLTPESADQMILQFLTQVIYASTAGTLHLSSKTATEPVPLGNQLSTFLSTLVSGNNTNFSNLVINLGLNYAAILAAFNSLPAPPSVPYVIVPYVHTPDAAPTPGILSTKVFTE
jgi:hypothetical protein